MRLPLSHLHACISILLTLAAPLSAQDTADDLELQETLLDHWRWVRFDTSDGLPDGRIRHLAETRGGVPWVSTSHGLALFDGYRWRAIEALPARGAIALCPGKGERMWILFPGVVHVVDGATGTQIESYDLGSLDRFKDLVALPDGVHVCGSRDRRSVLFDPVTGTSLDLPMRPALAPAFLRGTAQTPEHTLHGPGGVLTHRAGDWSVLQELPEPAVIWRGVVDNAHARGLVWIDEPYRDRGIWEWGPDAPVRSVPFSDQRALALDLHDSGRALAVVESGRIVTRGRDGSWEVLPTIPEPLSGVQHLRFRRNGDLWSVTGHGLFLMRVGSNQWRHRLEGFSQTDGVTTLDLMRTSSGDLWSGNGRGAHQFLAGGGRVHHRGAHGVAFVDVTTLEEDTQGRVWIGSGSGTFPGAFFWDGANWTAFAHEQGLRADAIHRIRTDDRGRVWFLALPTPHGDADRRTGGVFVLEDGRVRELPSPELQAPGSPPRYYDAIDAFGGGTWVGSLHGLWYYDEDLRPTHAVTGLRHTRAFRLQRHGGRIWFCHQDSAPGIGWIDDNGHAQYVPSEVGFPDPYAYDFEFDDDGVIWAACSTGLFTFANGTWSMCPADRSGSTGRLLAILPEPDEVFVGSVGAGTAVLDRRKIGAHPPKIEVSETAFESGATLLRWSCAAWWGTIPAASVRTRYRIDDEPWSDWSTRHSARRNLEPGKRTLEIEALGVFGDEDRSTLTRTIDVPRPLLRSPLFIVPVVVLASLVLGLGFLLFQRKHRESEALRESEGRFRQLTENMGEVFWLTDWKRKKLLYVSPSFDLVWGRSSADLLAGRAFWQDGIHPDERNDMVRRFAELAPRGEFDEVYRIVRPDGEVRWLRDRAYPIRDSLGAIHRIAGLTQDITAQKASEERQELLARELDHRVKNTLAGVLALTEQTAHLASDPQDFRDTIAGRIRAMARAHEALAAGRWEGVPLNDVITGIVRPYATSDEQVRAQGPATVLPPHMSTPICMALHELTTNAAKYGALSDPDGHVGLEWSADRDVLALTWSERGGPECVSPTRQGGFGLTLVRGFAEHELHGTAEIAFETTGLVCSLRVPITNKP